jgi:hypothetical protein
VEGIEIQKMLISLTFNRPPLGMRIFSLANHKISTSNLVIIAITLKVANWYCCEDII